MSVAVCMISPKLLLRSNKFSSVTHRTNPVLYRTNNHKKEEIQNHWYRHVDNNAIIGKVFIGIYDV